MAKNRKNTIPVLIDIRYAYSMNHFEEFYGDCITYAEVEQESYIDLKTMVFEKIGEEIKFRKFYRENNSLTVKADMLEKEFQIFKDILGGNVISKDKKNISTEESVQEKFTFFHDFMISNVKIMTKEDLLKCKKTLPEDEEEGVVVYENSEF
jgi:hypothetical protein